MLVPLKPAEGLAVPREDGGEGVAEVLLKVVHDRRRPPPAGRSAAAASPAPGPEQGTPLGLPVPTLLVVVALAVAAFSQGGYYGAGQRVVAALLGAAAVVALVDARGRPALRRSPFVACAALAGWSIVSASLAGDPAAAVPQVLLLLGAVITVLTCASLDGQQRDQLAGAAVALGVFVALTGWVGVAWHRTPWALVDQGLWRAATTLTYANAAAGFLAVLALLSLARSARSPSSIQATAATCLLLTGLGASLSRGGLVAFGVGVVVLARLLGVGAILRGGAAPATGSLLALAGLEPSIPASSPSRPGLAACALVLGLLLAVGMTRLGPRRLLAVAMAVPLTLLVLAAGPGRGSTQPVTDARFSIASSDRVEQARAALDVAASRPVTGVGPGQAQLSWVREDGAVLVARYAHNEYLQVLAELGVVGLGLVLGLLLVIGRHVRRHRATACPLPTWAGAVAGLVALAVHGLFDFGWHLPATALTGALLVGIVTPDQREDQL